VHVAQIGTGRVGRPTIYTIMCSKLVNTITVCDTKPGLSKAFAEELKHVASSHNLDITINSCENAEDVRGADIILISAGKPRTPGTKMNRRDLATQNGQIVKQISESTAPNNHNAKYVVITNPVDAMAMVCKKYSGAKFVIGTGTNLETLRLKTALSDLLNIPPSKIKGWVGGEHGIDAIILWSTITINNLPLDFFLEKTRKSINKQEIEYYVKFVSKFILDNIGATEYGPAASFRDIVRSMVFDTNELLAIATEILIEGISDPVFVSVPIKLGKSIGQSIYNSLSVQEKNNLKKAANSIYETFKSINF
jgi:malate dehydrogenase